MRKRRKGENTSRPFAVETRATPAILPAMKNIRGWQELPITEIRPRGWLRSSLQRQRDGLTGHLEVAGYPFNTEGWRRDALPRGPHTLASWWPFEQYAYWVDGMARCALLLGDAKLLRKARRQIDHVLNRPDADGYLGPASLKTLSDSGHRASERWPHAVFFRAIVADYAARPDRATLKKLIRHYLSNTAPHDRTRNVCNVEIMAWLYEQTGDRRMRDEAVRTYEQFQKNHPDSGAIVKNMLSDTRAGDHGPTYMELFKLGALLYRITGRRRWLGASINAQKKLARDHVLVDGVPSTTEHLRGKYSTAGHETCVVSDYPWALSYLLLATGNSAYADGIERAIFNALPGSATSDFKALQYFSGPNQVIATPNSNHHPHGKGGKHITYRPNPGTECCPGNIHRALPNYVSRMWMSDGKGGIVAACYGPSEVVAGRGARALRIVQETNYPFDDRIVFRFHGKRTTPLRFHFRIPSWCKNASATLNGRPLRLALNAGTFASLSRVFRDGDRLELHLPREWKIVNGPENGVSLEWGALVFAARIAEEWKRDEKDEKSSTRFPAWNLYPDRAWNRALVLPRGKAPLSVEFLEAPVGDNPWDPDQTPYRIFLPARSIPGWKLERVAALERMHEGKKIRVKGPFVFTPSLPSRKTLAAAGRALQTVELIPYGATRLRIAVFPRLAR